MFHKTDTHVPFMEFQSNLRVLKAKMRRSAFSHSLSAIHISLESLESSSTLRVLQRNNKNVTSYEGRAKQGTLLNVVGNTLLSVGKEFGQLVRRNKVE